MRECHLESALVLQAKRVGALALKWTSPGTTGVPDRIVWLPGGRVFCVELKAPGKKPTPLQAKVHQSLKALGHDVYVVDSKEGVYALPW